MTHWTYLGEADGLWYSCQLNCQHSNAPGATFPRHC